MIVTHEEALENIKDNYQKMGRDSFNTALESVRLSIKKHKETTDTQEALEDLLENLECTGRFYGYIEQQK